ncbi:MAG TPA: hypothetical protein VJL60_03870, partial [Gammaproteobacteria bacterium]|nr:hypothetical protein [Gammaproteobacteria bacterium]
LALCSLKKDNIFWENYAEILVKLEKHTLDTIEKFVVVEHMPLSARSDHEGTCLTSSDSGSEKTQSSPEEKNIPTDPSSIDSLLGALKDAESNDSAICHALIVLGKKLTPAQKKQVALALIEKLDTRIWSDDIYSLCYALHVFYTYLEASNQKKLKDLLFPASGNIAPNRAESDPAMFLYNMIFFLSADAVCATPMTPLQGSLLDLMRYAIRFKIPSIPSLSIEASRFYTEYNKKIQDNIHATLKKVNCSLLKFFRDLTDPDLNSLKDNIVALIHAVCEKGKTAGPNFFEHQNLDAHAAAQLMNYFNLPVSIRVREACREIFPEIPFGQPSEFAQDFRAVMKKVLAEKSLSMTVGLSASK